MKLNVKRFRDVLRSMGLKTRIALAVSAIFVLFAVGITYATLSFFEYEFKKIISKHLYSIASMQAANVDNKLTMAQKGLMARGNELPASAVSDHEEAQRFLDQSPALRAIFDNGLYLFDKQGNLIAETPYLPNRRGKNFAYREYFQKTISTGTSVVSSPYISTHTPGHPAVIITVPLFDKRGDIKAIFGGCFDLLGKNFLKDVAEARIGESGYIYIFDKQRTLVMHPDEKRIMTVAAAPGVNRAYDRAIAGFDGSDQTVNSLGVAMLVSFKHLNSAEWGVAATSPLEEAYHPLLEAKYYFIGATLAGMIIIIITVWCLTKGFLRPFHTLVNEVSLLPAKPAHKRFIEVYAGAEIAVLENAFNGMIAELEQQQKSLQESESNFRALADNANDGMVIVSEDGRFIYANKRLAEITGYTVAELLLLSLQDIAHPSGLVEMMARHTRTLGGRSVPKHHETCIVGKESNQIPVEVSNSMTLWQSKAAELIIFRDITERKVAEEKLQAERKLFIGGPTIVLKWKDEEDWPVEYVSPNILYQFGYHPEQFETGCGFASIIHPDDIDTIKAQVQTLHSLERPFVEQEYRIKRVDGDYRSVYDLTIPHLESTNGSKHYLAYIIDITERKDAEEKLALTEKLNTRISEIAEIVNWEYSLKTGHTKYSEKLCKLFGIPKQLNGYPLEFFLNFVHPEDKERVEKAFHSALRGESAFKTTCRVNLPDGSERTLYSEGETVCDKSGAAAYIIGFTQFLKERNES